MNPGDTRGLQALVAHGHCPLNEGRGMNPGDTTRCQPAAFRDSTAQRRPGDEPRRHFDVEKIVPLRGFAQRRPGDEPRRHVLRTLAQDQGARALNEGRGMNPGDTANVKEQLAESDGNQNLPLDGRLLDIVHAPAQAKTRLARDHRGLIPARRGCRTQDHRTFARPQNTQGSPSSRSLPRPKRVRKSASGPGKR